MAFNAGPIGVFDSGLGGLTVVREIRALRPDVPILYVADQAHVPYGERRLSDVCRLACAITGSLFEAGCRGVVMACNVSSAVALDVTRAAHPDHSVWGVVEPGAHAAVSITRNGKIGVLATAGTVQSGAYSHTLRTLDPALTVTEIACPAFVPLVESGQHDSQAACEAARDCLAPLLANDVDTIILGCTHYPFLLPVLRSLAPHLVFVNPAERAARIVSMVLAVSDQQRVVHQRAGINSCAEKNDCPADKMTAFADWVPAKQPLVFSSAGIYSGANQGQNTPALLLTTTGDVPTFAAQTRRLMPELSTNARFAAAHWNDSVLRFD